MEDETTLLDASILKVLMASIGCGQTHWPVRNPAPLPRNRNTLSTWKAVESFGSKHYSGAWLRDFLNAPMIVSSYYMPYAAQNKESLETGQHEP